MEESHVTERSPIREFITYHLMRHKPADEDTRQEAYDWQEQLPGGEVEEVEHRHTEKQIIAPRPQRQGADGTEHHAHHRPDECCLFSADPHFLMQEGRRHLMQ